MYNANVGFLLQLTCSFTKLDAYLQHKTTMSNNSVSKLMHEMVLNKLCLMDDHTFFKLSFVKLSFIKLSLGPLNWCTLFGSTMKLSLQAFSAKNIPWALLRLAITTIGLITNLIPSLPC